MFGARVHVDGRVLEARKPYRIAVVTTRSELDHYLLRKAEEAGAEILEKARVLRVEHGYDRAVVHTNSSAYYARYVIGADGAQSTTATAVRARLPRDQYAVTFAFDVPCTAVSPAAAASGLIDIHFVRANLRYGWVFPKRDHWTVGIGAFAPHASDVRAAAREFFESLQDLPYDRGVPIENATGWIVPAGGYSRPVGRGRLLLAGDAAGFVDPFYGEGIAYAILSGAQAGSLAGRASVHEPRGDPRHVQRLYSSFCRKSIVRDLRYARLFSQLLYKGPNVLLRRFSSDARLLNEYLDVPAARLTNRQYLRRFVWGMLRAGLRTTLRIR